MVEQCHLVRGIKADTHSAPRHIAFHEGMEQVFKLFTLDPGSIVFYNKVEHLVMVLYIEVDNAVLWCIFDSIGEQVVEDRLYKAMVEQYLSILIERGEFHRDMLLFGDDAEVEEDILCKGDDIVFLHLKS